MKGYAHFVQEKNILVQEDVGNVLKSIQTKVDGGENQGIKNEM